MENNNNESPAPAPETAATVEPVEERVSTPAPAAVSAVRKNGRNKRASSSKAAVSQVAETPSCGLVENITEASEKLSGKHISGYAPRDSERRAYDKAEEASKEADSADNTPDVEVREDEASKEEKVHEGPSFETAFVKNEAVEVSLSKENAPKSRPRGTDAFKKAEIPYGELKGDESVMPPCSFIEKVKKFLSGLFGGKGKKSKNNRGYKNGKDRKNFHGKGQRNFKNGGKGGFDKKRRDNRRGPKNFNNRRPNGGGKRKPEQNAE